MAKKNKRKNQPVNTPPRDRQTAQLAAVRDETWRSITNGLTPRKLNHILEDADNGDIMAQHQLFSDILDRDEHIMSEMGKRARALLSLQWDITPSPQMANDPRAQEIAKTVKSQFDSLPDLENLLLNLADGIGHGFSALEISWEYNIDKNIWLPNSIDLCPPSIFVLKDGELLLRNNSGEGEALRLGNWIIHRHSSKAGTLPRSGLLRTLTWTFLLKAYARAYWVRFLEVHGNPPRLGKYPNYSSPEEKTALLNALRSLGHDAAGIIPETMAIEFKEVMRASHAPFEAMISYCEKKQSIAILGGTLTSQADGKTSTNALGKVHENVKDDILRADAVCIAASITRQLLLPLAWFNQGVSEPDLMPWFVFDTKAPADLQALADALPKLARIMPRIPAAWAHEKTGIPMAADDEPVLIAAGPEPGMPFKAMFNVAGQSDRGQQKIDDFLTRDTQEIMMELLEPLLKDLRHGMDSEELLARLSTLFPQMDSQALQEQMAKVIFVADIWGRLNTQGK